MKEIFNKKILFAAFFIFLIFLFTATQARAGDYFPLKVGNYWNYDLQGMESLMTVKVAGREKIGGYNAYVVEFYLNGRLNSVSYYVKTPRDILILGVKDLDSGEKLIYKSPEKYLVLPVKLGDKWEIHDGIKNSPVKIVAKRESVNLSAGKFDTFYVKVTPPPKNVTGELWYAEGVGVVKMTIGEGKYKFSAPLVSYKVN